MDAEKSKQLYQLLHNEMFSSCVRSSEATHEMNWKVWASAFEAGVRFVMSYPRLATQTRDYWLEKPGDEEYNGNVQIMLGALDRFAGAVREEVHPGYKPKSAPELINRLSKIPLAPVADLLSASPAFDSKGELVWVPVKTPFVDGPMDYLPDWPLDGG